MIAELEAPSNSCEIHLHEQQSEAFVTEATEILYGGAAGGGKSHLMRVLAITLCSSIPGLQVFLFRRLSDDLEKNHMIGPGSFPVLLADLIKSGSVKHNGSKNFIRFWNGATIWLCHCQYEKDKFKYQGAEIHVLLIDELTHFSESIYRYLRARCRLGTLQVPAEWRDKLPLVLSGANPGGIGHSWVRRAFVKSAPPMKVHRVSKKEGGMLRQFIPAKLEDNPSLQENDPDYIDRLEGLGNEALVKAMKEGDWDIVAGGAVDDLWDEEILRVPRFKVPEGWIVDRSFDWGSSAPFSVGWWAEANGEEAVFPNGRVFCPPKGTLIRIDEWYGSKDGEVGTNVGLKMGSPEVARGILDREHILKESGWIETDVKPGPADNSISATNDDDTETIEKKMITAGVRWTKSDKSRGSRKIGLQLLRDRLKASHTGEGPGIFFCENCRATFDCLPVLPRDEKDPEDVDTEAEDHIYDEIRYKVLSKAKRKPKGVTAKHAR